MTTFKYLAFPCLLLIFSTTGCLTSLQRHSLPASKRSPATDRTSGKEAQRCLFACQIDARFGISHLQQYYPDHRISLNTMPPRKLKILLAN